MEKISEDLLNIQANDLKHCLLLADLSLQELHQDCPSAIMQTYPHGTKIYTQGKHCNNLFCILSGQVKLARVNYDGDEFTTGFLTAGELFGPTLGTSESLASTDTATAKGSVSLWRVPTTEFRNLLLHHSALSMRVIEALARRQRQMERRLECFAFKHTEARLAETLRELSNGFNTRCEHGFGMHIRLSQQELADLVGASRPVISTILNKLRKTGVLNYNREYLCVRGIADIEHLIGK